MCPWGVACFPVILAIAAAILDGHGSHGLARDALLAACRSRRSRRSSRSASTSRPERGRCARLCRRSCGASATTLLVVSCAARSPEAATHTLPPLGRSALIGCLAVFALKASVAAVQHGRRLVLRPAKP